MQRKLGILFISLLFSGFLTAQDTLPHFSATNRGAGKILISWHNNYPVVTQISIQRSADSLKYFTTLLTVPDPTLPENGAVDGKAPAPDMFYRLFIVFDNGRYVFTTSRRPQVRPSGAQSKIVTREDDAADMMLARAAGTRVLYADPLRGGKAVAIRSPAAIRGTSQIADLGSGTTIYVQKNNSIIARLTGKQIPAFRDSMINRTRDTLVVLGGDTLTIRPYMAPEVYRVSPFVYTGRYGNVHVSLPEAGRRHYSVKFFDDNNKLLFELSEIKDPSLIVDKTNFQHAGWFRFELYEGEQLKEKNKLFIPKEF